MAAAAQKQTTARSRMVDTRLFGAIEVQDAQRVNLPDGIIGFSSAHEFALLPAGPANFFWLQSLEHAALAFLLADPFPYFDSYVIDVPDQVVARLEAERANEILVLAVLTLGAGDKETTANLQGPVLINLGKRVGQQYVVQNSPYTTREVIPASLLP